MNPNQKKALLTFFSVSKLAFATARILKSTSQVSERAEKMEALHEAALQEVMKDEPQMAVIDNLLREMQEIAEKLQPEPDPAHDPDPPFGEFFKQPEEIQPEPDPAHDPDPPFGEFFKQPEERHYFYESKCRICANITEWFFATSYRIKYTDLLDEMSDYTINPRLNRCNRCQKMTIQDVVSYRS
jgi:hypothetical protein